MVITAKSKWNARRVKLNLSNAFEPLGEKRSFNLGDVAQTATYSVISVFRS